MLQRREGLGLRGHAAAEGFAAGEQGHTGEKAGSFANGSANRGVSDSGWVCAFGTLFHVGKLVAKRRDVAFGEAFGNGGHKGVSHSCASAVGEDIAGSGGGWSVQESGDARGC